MKRIKLFEEFSSQPNIKDRFLELVDERLNLSFFLMI